MTVLVVEDNARNMKLFRDVLQASGYRIIEATTGERAVALAAKHGPDLVLMDIQLPDIDGLEALDRLKADERTAAVPVLALTAQAMEGDRERFLAAGFDGYLSKPVNVADFVATVRRFCDRCSPASELGARPRAGPLALSGSAPPNDDGRGVRPPGRVRAAEEVEVGQVDPERRRRAEVEQGR